MYLCTKSCIIKHMETDMKKLCFVNYDMTVTGGVEQVTTSLANAFCNDYEVYIYAIFGKGKKVPYDWDKRIIYKAELTEDCRIRKRIMQVFTPFKKFVIENKIDIVFLMENHPALIVSPVRFFTKAKYIFCDHGALMNEWKKKDITLFRFWDSLISHKVVTLTEQTRLDYIKKFHLNPKRIQSIYNWIPQEVLCARRPYDLNTKEIITVGRFSEEKGYDMLVEVAKKVLPEFPDWTWHLYGNGDTLEKTVNRVKEFKLDAQVIFEGNIKNAYQHFHKYAFLVLPSYREGLPLTLLEAKACGLPMVSFDVTTGPGEIIEDGKDGYLVAPYDLEQMAERMIELMEDSVRRQRFSEYTQKNIQKFEKNQIYKQWIELIEELLHD